MEVKPNSISIQHGCSVGIYCRRDDSIRTTKTAPSEWGRYNPMVHAQ
jgi:hypothetical protein